MKKKAVSFEKCFAVRSLVCYFLILSLMLFSLLRVSAVGLKDYSSLQSVINGERVEIWKIRGSILDTNGVNLTNSETVTVAAIMPTDAAISVAKANLSGNEKQRVLSLLESGKPAVSIMSDKVECDGISYINIPVRVSDAGVAHHIVGYLDGDGNGADGIEKAYDEFLSDDAAVSATFATDGRGKLLLGIPPEFNGDVNKVTNAVYLTLDINLQKKAEIAAEGLISGAVIVSECSTGKIRAMVSLPDFSPEDLSKSLAAENSPFLNKCLLAYNVGSAFKPCVAAAAIESGAGDKTVDCKGNTVIENRIFNCHKTSGHGVMTLDSALKNSCNCYFYLLAGELGAKTLFKAAEYMSFGSRIKLAENLYTASGNIPSAKEIKTECDMANFGIGQGYIMISPVAMLNLYNAVANGGEYYLPSVVEKTSEGGNIKLYEKGKPTKAMSKETAEILKNALVSVVNEGTGTAAKSEKVSSAGKTATAQTGRRKPDGSEITNSWFCGFFPAEEPRYTVIVMSDGDYEKSPAAVFKDICESYCGE